MSNKGRVQDLVAIVTGAGSGIGQASAIRLAEESATVICADINLEAATATAQQIKSAGFAGEGYKIDISDSQACTDLVDSTATKYGSIDILVNNAGVNLPGVFHEVTNEIIDRTLNVNVKGAMYLTRAALPHMLKNKRGSIVNMSSVNGLVSEPYLSVYSASKGAIVMFTRGIALDYAKTGIRCNAICPGWVETALIEPQIQAKVDAHNGDRAAGIADLLSEKQPSRRMSSPADIGAIAVFLCSPAAHNITGTAIPVDGGWTAQ